MAEKKRASRKKAVSKPDPVEKHEGKPMPPSNEEGRFGVLAKITRREVISRKSPLPLAEEFVKYKKGHEEAPERLLRFMEREQEQSIKDRNAAHAYIQKQGLAESRRKDKAQWFGFIVTLSVIIAATFAAIYIGGGWWYAVFALMPLPLFAERLLSRYTRHRNKDEDE